MPIPLDGGLTNINKFKNYIIIDHNFVLIVYKVYIYKFVMFLSGLRRAMARSS